MNKFSGGVFLENIEWFDESGKELVHRLPQDGSGEIKYGARLTVRESQATSLLLPRCCLYHGEVVALCELKCIWPT
jgi:hypothetical protein